MEFSNVVFVAGFGASPYYSEQMCRETQRLTSRKVHNLSLKHGLTLEEECNFLIGELNKLDVVRVDRPLILMGFSTGCVVVMRLSVSIPTAQVILINPAELLTRLNLNLLESFVDPKEFQYHRNISSYLPILRRVGYSAIVWKLVWSFIGVVFWILLSVWGSSNVARFYYKNFGEGFHEPRADELEKLLFKPGRRFDDLTRTLMECIVKPSLHEMISNSSMKVHIVEGYSDLLYIPYTNLLFEANPNVILHKTIGDHHMIYHHPIETAQKLSSIITTRTCFI